MHELRQFSKGVLLSVLFVVAVLSGSLVSAQAENPLPAPTGTYDIGVEWRRWVDESRDEPYDDVSDAKREVIVAFYYPAEVAADAEPAPYMDNRAEVLPAFAGLMEAFVAVTVETQPEDLDSFQSHAYPNAPISEDQASYPVLIFSPGAASDVRMYTAQIEELASHGYIVAAINHVYGVAFTTLNDGTVAVPTYNTGLEGAAQVWSQDQIFVMDQLEALNANDPESMFTNRLDLERMGVFGASLGGSTTTNTCFVDARCKAAASDDGDIYGDAVTQGLDQPFLHLLSDGSPMSKPTLYDASRGPVYSVTVEGFAHLNFGDFPLWPNVETIQAAGWLSDADGARSVEITNAALVAFFDKYLKGSDESLQEALSAYPEVTISSRNEGSTSSEEAHKEAMLRIADEGLTQGNAAILEQFIADDYVVHSPFGDLGRDDVRGLFDAFRAAMTDFKVSRENMVAEGDSIAMRTILTGTFENDFNGPFGLFAPTGQPFRLELVNIFQFNEDGKIQEEWVQFDTANFMMQLGATPAPASVDASAGVLSQEAADNFVERFDAIFDGPDNNVIADEIFAPEFVGHLPLAPELDLASWKAYVASFYAAFPDLTEDVNQVIIAPDRLILFVTYTGTHEGDLFGIPATGKSVSMDGIGIFAFNEDGLVVENWAVLDVVGVLAQIGAFPPAPAE